MTATFHNCKIVFQKVICLGSHLGTHFSLSKKLPTVKGLVGITPYGVGCFFSDLMPGSTSDNEISLQSGVVDLVEPRRDVMSDTGFTIQDTCVQKGLYHFAPPTRFTPQLRITRFGMISYFCLRLVER